MRRYRLLALLTLILLVAAALRLVGVTAVSPPGISHDEVANWLIDRTILDTGSHAVYFTRAYGHEAGFHYLQAAFVALLGDNTLALRLPAVFLGLLLIAISCTLNRKLFGQKAGLWAAALLAVLFWPVFFSRQGLRAMSLPVLSGLSAYFWWQFWGTAAKKQAAGGRQHYLPYVYAALAGLLAGSTLYTYMAARAVPIFYAAFLGYLVLWHRQSLKARWRHVALFWLVFVVVAAPITLFLLTTPGAEYRLGEVNAPLQALLAGDFAPVLENGWRILGMAGFRGDPLWRQNVAERPLFDPILATLFYASILLSLMRIRDSRYAFLLLWLLTGISPSLVTIDAPSSIRMVNILPFVTVVPAIVIHSWDRLSTVFPKLSTVFEGNWGKVLVTAVILYHIGWTSRGIFWQWPANDEVQFVWQTAFANTAAYLDNQPDIQHIALAGWSPDTMDAPSFALLSHRQDLAVSHFGGQMGTLLLPTAVNGRVHIFRPAILPLDPVFEAMLTEANAIIRREGTFVHYEMPPFAVTPQVENGTMFGDELLFLGYSVLADGRLLTQWQVVAVPVNGRRLFIHYLDKDGNVLAEDYQQDTADPQNLFQPHWQTGDTLLQIHPAPPQGSTAIRIGWFDPYTCPACQNLAVPNGEPFLVLPLP